MKKETRIRNVRILFAALALTIIFTSLSSAEFIACFKKGQVINYCNPLTPDDTCTSPFDCTRCMSSYNETRTCFNQGSPNRCNAIKGPINCTNIGSNSTDMDTKAPNITLLSPKQGNLYIKSAVNFDIKLDEEGYLSYMLQSDPLKKWVTLCNKCDSYNRSRTFKEGPNNVTIMAKDLIGNIAYKNISFIVDSKKPQINKISPRSGFTSGFFDIYFTEANPRNLSLIYGNSTIGIRTTQFNINSDCTPLNNSKYSCSKKLDLSDFNGKQIEFLFNLSDVANSRTSTRPTKVKVDSVYPIINSITYTKSFSSIRLKINVTELNLDEITYIDNSNPRARESRICSSLRNNVCEKTISFIPGTHNLDFQVTDEAGNSVSQSLVITI